MVEIGKRTRGYGRSPWEQRLSSTLAVTAFLAVHCVYNPLHLASEEHGDEPASHATTDGDHGHAHPPHEHPHPPDDGDPPSPTHSPHSAGDHELLGLIARPSTIPLQPAAILAPAPVAHFVDSAPRVSSMAPSAIEPRPPPHPSPLQPRAPPIA